MYGLSIIRKKLTPYTTPHIIETGGIRNVKYEMNAPRSGSIHYAFRKQGCMPITVPKHEPVKKVYVEMVRQIVESEAKNDEDAE